MAVSETLQYVIIFGLAVVFSVLALTLSEKLAEKVILKILAGIFWFFFGIFQFIAGDPTATVTYVYLTVFWLLGFVFFASTIQDWRVDQKGSWGRRLDR